MDELDTATIKRAARGDNKAFKQLYDHYAPFVWKITYRTVNANSDAASEVVQETFVRLSRSLRKFKHNSGLSTWIYRIAYNAAMSLLARTAADRDRSVAWGDTLETQGKHEEADARRYVEQILDTVSAEERFLLVSREVTGLSFDDLAVITGKNAGALRTSLHRLKERLRKEFADE